MNEILQLLEQMASQQDSQLLRLARRHLAHLTLDDLLQPNDFQQLEQDPEFRFEEGIRMGLLSALSAIRAHLAAKS